MTCDDELNLNSLSHPYHFYKQSQVNQHKIIKRVAFEGVSKISFYTKKKVLYFLCKTRNILGRKHPQIQHDYIPYCVSVQYFLNLNFNSFLKITQMVTIHVCKYNCKYNRGNILVWIVVNCKIPLVEIFYNKEQAMALVSILHEYERKHFKKKITHTIYVQRDTDRLSGIIPRRDE